MQLSLSSLRKNLDIGGGLGGLLKVTGLGRRSVENATVSSGRFDGPQGEGTWTWSRGC